MAWGKEAFTDRNGDYKNPTIVDLDKEYGKKKSYEVPLDQFVDRTFLENYKQEQIDFIMKCNPFYVAAEYPHFINRVNKSKLEWNIDKLMDALQSDTVRYAMYTLLEKRSQINL